MAALTHSLSTTTVVATLLTLMMVLFSSMTTVDAMTIGECPDICKCFKYSKPNIYDQGDATYILNKCNGLKYDFTSTAYFNYYGDYGECPYMLNANVYDNYGSFQCAYSICMKADSYGKVTKIASNMTVYAMDGYGTVYDSGAKACNGSFFVAPSIVATVSTILLSVVLVTL